MCYLTEEVESAVEKAFQIRLFSILIDDNSKHILLKIKEENRALKTSLIHLQRRIKLAVFNFPFNDFIAEVATHSRDTWKIIKSELSNKLQSPPLNWVLLSALPTGKKWKKVLADSLQTKCSVNFSPPELNQ